MGGGTLAPDAYLLVAYVRSTVTGTFDYVHPAVRLIYIESALQPVSVTLAGTGTGSVTSNPAGLSSCSGSAGMQCSGNFGYDTTVTLTALGTGGNAFLGWSGACTGSGPCGLTT